jgi:hypothetical protein
MIEMGSHEMLPEEMEDDVMCEWTDEGELLLELEEDEELDRSDRAEEVRYENQLWHQVIND